MKAADLKLERQLAELRSEAAPSLEDKRRVLTSVRATLESAWIPPVEPEVREPRDTAPRAQNVPAAPDVPANVSAALWVSLRPWLGGALIGAALGLGLGLLWGSGHPSATPNQTRASVEEASVLAPVSQRAASVDSPLLPSPAPEGIAAPSTAASDGVAAARATPPQRRLLRPHAGRVAAPRTLDLDRALALLQRAERALHAAEPELALGLLRELDRRAAWKLLRQERLTTLALALCKLDRKQEARAARQALLREFQSTIYASRLERSCASEPPEQAH